MTWLFIYETSSKPADHLIPAAEIFRAATRLNSFHGNCESSYSMISYSRPQVEQLTHGAIGRFIPGDSCPSLQFGDGLLKTGKVSLGFSVQLIFDYEHNNFARNTASKTCMHRIGLHKVADRITHQLVIFVGLSEPPR